MPRSLAVLAPVLALLLAADAGAATLELRCAGSGARNEDSSGEKICAAPGTAARRVAGTVKNDAGQPVAATVVVARREYTPAGPEGFSVETKGEERITAKADGTFSFSSDPDPIFEYQVRVLADPALGIGGEVTQLAKVERQVLVEVARLGGGRVRLSTKGAPKNTTARILDGGGYPLRGVGKKKLVGGKATFRLGRGATGTFSYGIDLGRFADLYWFSGRRPTFRLRDGA